MGLMGLEAIYPKPRLSVPGAAHKVYPYLLHGVEVTHPDQVWSTDITYVPMPQGFMYLVAIMDWYSRYVLAWQLSNTLELGFCLVALEEALGSGQPDIFNTDQGSQFTAQAFTGRLEEAGVAISMDGRGRVLENILVERLWRTVKYEDIYLKEYRSVLELERGLEGYFWKAISGSTITIVCTRLWSTRRRLRSTSVPWQRSRVHREFIEGSESRSQRAGPRLLILTDLWS